MVPYVWNYIRDTDGVFCALLTWTCPLFSFLFLFFLRVINAGKSTHNEDQASCEVLFVKKKAGGANSTPNKNSSTKRRSSLPNGEGLQLKDNSVSIILYLVSGEVQNKYKRMWQHDSKRCLLNVSYIFSYLLLIISA